MPNEAAGLKLAGWEVVAQYFLLTYLVVHRGIDKTLCLEGGRDGSFLLVFLAYGSFPWFDFAMFRSFVSQ